MKQIARSAKKGDRDALRYATHALRGSLGTIDAQLAHQAAARLEDAAAHSDDNRDVGALVTDLAAEIARLNTRLTSSTSRARRPARRARRR
jgi:HPt (histidine-containing phosphotransfer) domain-containing protein